MEISETVSASLHCLKRINFLFNLLDLHYAYSEKRESTEATVEIKQICAELAELLEKLENMRASLSPDDAAYLLSELNKLRADELLN